MKSELFEETNPVLRMSMEPTMIQRLITVLQSGFFRDAVQGQTIYSFLSTLPGFNKDYITNRIQTIFLNGDSVDDMNLAFTGNTEILAISAAMPGLAGSLFRKCSPLTVLRKTAVQKKMRSSGAPVEVQLKIFNVIAVEKGSGLFADGVVLNCNDVLSFLELRPSLVNAMNSITLDNKPILPEELLVHLSMFPKILFKCNASDV